MLVCSPLDLLVFFANPLSELVLHCWGSHSKTQMEALLNKFNKVMTPTSLQRREKDANDLFALLFSLGCVFVRPSLTQYNG